MEGRHIEEHSLVVKCVDRQTMLKVFDVLKYHLDGFNEDFTVNILADYDIHFTNEEV